MLIGFWSLALLPGPAFCLRKVVLAIVSDSGPNFVSGPVSKLPLADEKKEAFLSKRERTDRRSTHLHFVPLAWDIHEGVEIIVDDVLSSQREDLTVSISLVAVLLIRKLAVLELTIRGNLLETARTKQSIARNLLKSLTVPMLHKSNAAIGVDS